MASTTLSPRSPSLSVQPNGEDIDTRNPSGLTAMLLYFLALPIHVSQRLLPRLLPVLVCLLCIPILMFFSGAAGWVVWSNVPVNWKADAFLQYGEASIPFANVVLPQILADQPYDVSLYLVVPTTDSNYALGNFMATLKITTAYNDSIVTVRRPATLVPPRSSLAKQLLLGSPDAEKLEILLLSQFVSGTSTLNARIEVGRSDSWRGVGNGQGRELSVIEAKLMGRVRPKGITAILARYPRLATFISTFTFFFVSLLVTCGMLFVTFRSEDSSHRHPRKNSDSEDIDDNDDSPRFRHTHKRHTRQEADRRESASGSSAAEDKQPPESASTSVRMSSLRKRRSSPAMEPMGTTRIKIEDMPVRRGTTPPSYPKSPYPRLPSTGSDSNSRQRSAVAEPVSPSDADAESL